MKSALGGILTGSLLLIVGEVLLTASGTSSSGANTLLSLFQLPARLAGNWMSPDVPLIPDLSKSTPPGSSTQAQGTPASTAAARMPLVLQHAQ